MRTLAGTCLFASPCRMDLRLTHLLVQQTPASFFPELKQAGLEASSLSPLGAEHMGGWKYTYTHSCSSQGCAQLSTNLYPPHLTFFPYFPFPSPPSFVFPSFYIVRTTLSRCHFASCTLFLFAHTSSRIYGSLYFLPTARTILISQGLFIVQASRSQTHHTRQDFSGRVISPSQRTVPDNTQQSKETDIHSPGGIRTCNHSRQTAVDPCLRLRGHKDRPSTLHYIIYLAIFSCFCTKFLHFAFIFYLLFSPLYFSFFNFTMVFFQLIPFLLLIFLQCYSVFSSTFFTFLHFDALMHIAIPSQPNLYECY